MSWPLTKSATGFLLGSMPVLVILALLLHDSQSPEPVTASSIPSVTAAETHFQATSADVENTVAVNQQPITVVTEEEERLAVNTELDVTAPVTSAASQALIVQAEKTVAEPGVAIPIADIATLSRQPIWSPFRSHWAAQGFAQRLALVTDVPVEVVNDSVGVYQVVFRYRDEAERQAVVSHIESVTGLELTP